MGVSVNTVYQGDPPACHSAGFPLIFPSFVSLLPNMNMISHPATYEMIYQLSTGNPGVLVLKYYNIIPPRHTLILSPLAVRH